VNKYGDNALFRGVLAVVVTFFVGPYLVGALVFYVMPQRPYLIAVIWPVAIGVGVGVWLYSRRRDRAAEWGDAGRCRGCGYDLTKNESGRCPECGLVREKVGHGKR